MSGFAADTWLGRYIVVSRELREFVEAATSRTAAIDMVALGLARYRYGMLMRDARQALVGRS